MKQVVKKHKLCWLSGVYEALGSRSGWIVIVLIMLFVASASAQDSATVRVRVDIDSVSLTIDGELVEQDSYGNRLVAEAYFILQLAPGSKSLKFSHPNYEPIIRSVTLVAGEVVTLEIDFIEDTVEVGSALVKISSIPDSAEITIDGKVQAGIGSQEYDLSAGEHTIELILPGYEPLSHTMTMSDETNVTLNFLLRAFPPEIQTEEMLGLIRLPKETLMDLRLADQKMSQYTSMAETFVVIPFGQGVMGKVLLDEEDQGTANALLISGAVLTLGSYVIGKILSGKKRRFMEAENVRIERDNELAVANNRQIDLTIRQLNQTNQNQWEANSLLTGKVEVRIVDRNPTLKPL